MFEKYLALPPLTASALSGAVTTTIAIAAWITVPFIEKAGRRKWLIVGSCLQTVFLAIVSGLSSHPSYKNSAAAAAFLFAFAVVLGATWDPFPVSSPFPLSFTYRVSRMWEMIALPRMLTANFRHKDSLCLRINASSLSPHGLLPLHRHAFTL